MSNETPPLGLDSAGRDLWVSVVKTYSLRPDELAILESASKTADRIVTIEQEWVALGKPMLTTGSQGQDVIHPLFSEQKAHHAALATLLGKLSLPDTPTGAVVNQNRAAGQSRWASAHGGS